MFGPDLFKGLVTLGVVLFLLGIFFAVSCQYIYNHTPYSLKIVPN